MKLTECPLCKGKIQATRETYLDNCEYSEEEGLIGGSDCGLDGETRIYCENDHTLDQMLATRVAETWPTEECMNTMLPIVANSWAELRGCDVYRLLNSLNYERLNSLLRAAEMIVKQRPDLESQVLDARIELEQEYAAEEVWE